jgi:hypothetical protein
MEGVVVKEIEETEEEVVNLKRESLQVHMLGTAMRIKPRFLLRIRAL